MTLSINSSHPKLKYLRSSNIHHLLLWRPPCCQGKEYICQHGLPARSVSGNLQRRRYIGRKESIRSRHWIDPPRPIISWQPCANGGRPISPSICGGVGTRMRPSGGQQPSGPKLPRCGTKKLRSISFFTGHLSGFLTCMALHHTQEMMVKILIDW